MKGERVVYYKDELEDEFADIKKEDIEVGENFVYIRKNPIWRFFSFIVYRIIMTPIAFLHCKIKFGLKIVGKEKLKGIKGGVFLYGNHTLAAGDAFIPNLILFPKKVYVVVRSANISTKGTKNIIMMNGALPLPTKITAMKNFISAMETRYSEGAAIVIYPEAHIWPYYTGIRPFKKTSFVYPAKLGAPVFSSTVTYRKRKFRKTPKVVVYLDGPFYAEDGLPDKQKAEVLRNAVYEKMTERAKTSDVERIKYVKAGEEI